MQAQTSPAPTPLDANGRPAWAAASRAEAARLRAFLAGQPKPLGYASEENPAALGTQTVLSRDKAGLAGTYLSLGPVASTATEPFFMPLGSNDRTCQSCHQPDSGFTITPMKIRKLFQSDPSAPLFRPIDGAVCPTADTSTPAAARSAYSLLINQGLIRVYIPMPAADILQFSITGVADPYGCTSNPATGLTSPTTGFVSQYRRPQPASNSSFLTTIMWDGREPSLQSQANDAVMLHAAAAAVPSNDAVNSIVQFEAGLFSAQTYDLQAGDLTAGGVQGGPAALAAVPFVAGINAPGPGFNASVMTMFLNWNDSPDPNQAAIARGQNIFNEKPFNITGVNGLNDVAGKPSIPATCSACHNNPSVGNHSSAELLDLGVEAPPAAIASSSLAVANLPVFTVHCDAGPLAGTDRQVTDLGRALITGQCSDIGKVKTALLRDLAVRPPYFHNGSAPDLASVVDFYNNRFSIGLTDQEKSDLTAFLSTL